MRRVTAFCLALPAIFIVILFAVVLASFVSVSLLHVDPGGAVFHGPPNLRNYTRLLGSTDAWRSIANTVRLSALVTVICAVLGFPLARLLARAHSPTTRRAILFCLIAAVFSGGVTRAYAWLILLGNHGLINQGLQAIGLPHAALVNNETGVAIAMLNFVLPFFVLTLF
ncbi:MAG TPA: hypothetical protein VMB84_19225, partial [Stellaceae bacterium]|nr:hypothetical protein [Stellaceae bacterium]